MHYWLPCTQKMLHSVTSSRTLHQVDVLMLVRSLPLFSTDWSSAQEQKHHTCSCRSSAPQPLRLHLRLPRRGGLPRQLAEHLLQARCVVVAHLVPACGAGGGATSGRAACCVAGASCTAGAHYSMLSKHAATGSATIHPAHLLRSTPSRMSCSGCTHTASQLFSALRRRPRCRRPLSRRSSMVRPGGTMGTSRRAKRRLLSQKLRGRQEARRAAVGSPLCIMRCFTTCRCCQPCLHKET